MSDTMVPIADDPPKLANAPGVALPGLPGFEPSGERKRSTPWALIIGLVVATFLIVGIVGGLILISSAGASAAAGCGGG